VRKLIGILLAFFIVVLVSCEKKQNETPVVKAILVEVVQVRQGNIAKEIKFTGNIEANTKVQVYPKITAKIEEMKVDSGDTIKKNDVIALLEYDELQAQLAQAEAALEVVQAKWAQMEVGARPEELAQAEDLVAKARANLKDAENNYGRMRALFERGTIARRQFEAAELAYTVAKADLNSAIERLEMLKEGATREDRQALQAQVSQAKSSYWPTVSLSGSYGWQGDALLDQEGGWSAGLNISLPIFEGFSRKAKVVHATLSLQEEDLKLQELEDRIEEEVEQAYSNWELAQKNVHVSEMPLEAAREMYQLTRLHYEQGLTSYLSLQQKESSLTQAEYNHANALFNLRTSGARLQRVSGRRNQ